MNYKTKRICAAVTLFFFAALTAFGTFLGMVAALKPTP